MTRMENPNVGRQKWPVFLAALTKMARGERLGKNGRITMAATSAGQCPTLHIIYLINKLSSLIIVVVLVCNSKSGLILYICFFMFISS